MPSETENQSLQNLRTVGRYRIERLLGQGGSGVVFLGRDPYIKRQVAIKVSRPISPISRESFFVEAQSAGRLNHPHIVAIYDFGLHGDFSYITMEYVEGSTIEDYCRRDNLAPLSKVVEIVFSVAVALDAAHKQGVIHQDIKPSNILIDKNGITKITDFGTAQMDEPDPGNRIIVGTPHYIAPERLQGRKAERQSDIYSLGCVLYELLSGEKAFEGSSLAEIKRKVLRGSPRPLTDLRPDLPEPLVAITEKAIARDPDDRFQSCADFAYYMRLALRDLTEPAKDARDFFDYVQSVSFFQNFTKDQVKELVRASNIIRVKRGKIIISEGEIDDTFFVILSGKVKVIKDNRTLALVEAGECFGEMALLGNQARAATVVAESDCTLIKISSILLNKSSESIQLLFYQKFAVTLVRRLSQSARGKD